MKRVGKIVVYSTGAWRISPQEASSRPRLFFPPCRDWYRYFPAMWRLLPSKSRSAGPSEISQENVTSFARLFWRTAVSDHSIGAASLRFRHLLILRYEWTEKISLGVCTVDVFMYDAFMCKVLSLRRTAAWALSNLSRGSVSGEPFWNLCQG